VSECGWRQQELGEREEKGEILLCNLIGREKFLDTGNA